MRNNTPVSATPLDKISIEFAEMEFDRFASAMDLDLDIKAMDEEDLMSFKRQKSKIIRAVMQGGLVFNDNAEAVYTPSNPRTIHQDPITFHERSGASLIAMDGKKKNHDVAKTYAVLGDMCKVPPKVFAGMVGKDVKLCEALFSLLMD